MSVIGIDLGGTKLAGALFDDAGTMLLKETLPLEKRSGRDVGALISTMVHSLKTVSIPGAGAVTAIGICVPGISWSKTGRVWAPNIPGWEDYPLLAEMREAAGSEIEVRIDSDRACYILGEVWQGAARGCRDAIFLAVGTGIGAGILVNGRILRGSHDIAGAIGWLALDRPFLQEYAACGCFEGYASGEGIAKTARALLAAEPQTESLLRSIEPSRLTAHDVFKAYDRRDPLAVKTFDICIEFWGMAAANLVSLFNPEKIIFGGGVFGPAVWFIDAIMAEARKWAQPISIKQVSFSGSTLGGDAGVIGAGALALGQGL